MKQFTVNNENAGQRLNKYCGRILAGAPQSFIYRMLRKKNITLNGKKADGSELLASGDEIRFFLSDETFEKFSGNTGTRNLPSVHIPPLTAEEIVYEDGNILVCYKPEGELSQKAKPGDISFNERIVSYLETQKKSGAEPEEANGAGVKFVPGICNRLDRNTRGLITAGKNLQAQRFLCELFRQRNIDKYYIAVVGGSFSGRVDSKLYIRKDEKQNISDISPEEREGYSAVHSVFYGLAGNGRYSVVKIKLKTGKSHQIRAQLAYLGTPIVGDAKYGDKTVNGIAASKYGIRTQMLLAYELVFPECAGAFSGLSKKVIKCRIPYEFKAFWEENRLWAHGNPEDLEVHF